jgi:hypothetical protein
LASWNATRALDASFGQVQKSTRGRSRWSASTRSSK